MNNLKRLKLLNYVLILRMRLCLRLFIIISNLFIYMMLRLLSGGKRQLPQENVCAGFTLQAKILNTWPQSV
jgi:hypothetical protein